MASTVKLQSPKYNNAGDGESFTLPVAFIVENASSRAQIYALPGDVRITADFAQNAEILTLIGFLTNQTAVEAGFDNAVQFLDGLRRVRRAWPFESASGSWDDTTLPLAEQDAVERKRSKVRLIRDKSWNAGAQAFVNQFLYGAILSVHVGPIPASTMRTRIPYALTFAVGEAATAGAVGPGGVFGVPVGFGVADRAAFWSGPSTLDAEGAIRRGAGVLFLEPADLLVFDSAVTLNALLAVLGNVTVSGTLTAGGAATFEAAANLNGLATFSEDVSVTGDVNDTAVLQRVVSADVSIGAAATVNVAVAWPLSFVDTAYSYWNSAPEKVSGVGSIDDVRIRGVSSKTATGLTFRVSNGGVSAIVVRLYAMGWHDDAP